MTGIFVAFEGIDGSGKTTAAQAIAELLRQQGQIVVATREPGGTVPGTQIRALLLDADHQLAPETELLLMCADRAEHVATVVRPALERGAVVISDRYAGSTRAYQGYGLGLDPGVVDAAIGIATGGLCPDLTILFDLDPDLGNARRYADKSGVNQLDARDLAYRRRVREGFLELARASDRWQIVDASQPLEIVIERAAQLVTSLAAPKRVTQ